MNEPKYKPSVGLWEKSTGTLMSMVLDAQAIAAFKQAEVGGKVCVYFVKERTKENSPNARIIFISAADAAAFKANSGKPTGKAARKVTEEESI